MKKIQFLPGDKERQKNLSKKDVVSGLPSLIVLKNETTEKEYGIVSAWLAGKKIKINKN